MAVEQAQWARSLKGPVDSDGIYLLRNFTLQDDYESVLVNEKRMRQVHISLDVPIRVLLRQEALAESEKKEPRSYRPLHAVESKALKPQAVIDEHSTVLNLNSESAQKQQLSPTVMHASLDGTHVKCHNCGGYHFTHNCPQRETYKRDIITAKGGIYVPPSKKNGLDKKTYSLKLDPVPSSWTKDNLQKLVESLCDELRSMLRTNKIEAAGKIDINSNEFKALPWRMKTQLYQEQMEASASGNSVQAQAKQEAEGSNLQTEPAKEPEPEPEDEQTKTLRLAIAGLRLERASFPISKIDGRKQGYAYINLGTEEAQRAFKARWDGSKLLSEQMIMHVLLPEEYGPARK